jgi:hypothetical protein
LEHGEPRRRLGAGAAANVFGEKDVSGRPGQDGELVVEAL